MQSNKHRVGRRIQITVLPCGFVRLLILLLVLSLNTCVGLWCLDCNTELNHTGCVEGETKWSAECVEEWHGWNGLTCFQQFKTNGTGEPMAYRGCMQMLYGQLDCRPTIYGQATICYCRTDNCNADPYIPYFVTEHDNQIASGDPLLWPWIVVGGLCSLILVAIICIVYRRYRSRMNTDTSSTPPFPSSTDNTSV